MKTSVFLAFLFLLLGILIMLSGCKKQNEDTFLSDSAQSYTYESFVSNDTASENTAPSVDGNESKTNISSSSLVPSGGNESKENTVSDTSEPLASSNLSSSAESSSQTVDTTPIIPGVSSVPENSDKGDTPEQSSSGEVSSVTSSEQGVTTEKPDHVYDNAIV